jgi:hypothetical protein
MKSALMRFAAPVVIALTGTAGLALAQPQSFNSPEAAVAAVVSAIEAQDRAALLTVFGPENEDVVFVGDPDKDREVWSDFLTAYKRQNRIDTSEPGRAVLHIGREDWPFPAVIVGSGTNWAFDGAAAREEVRLRRIGLNELDVIDLLKAGVGVQTQYRQTDHDGDGVMEFAASILSKAGQRDGLYWPDEPGTPQSPIGPFMAEASADGYTIGPDTNEPNPYLGYYFRVLQKQGPDAPGGAHDYMIGGNMVAGYAFLAFPADYGETGIMSFMVGENGVVYEADLGADTLAVANRIVTFNPHDGWKPVE